MLLLLLLLAVLPAPCSRVKRLVGVRLRQLGQGSWQRDGVSKKLKIQEPGLELWRTKITKGGRIIWQVRGRNEEYV